VVDLPQHVRPAGRHVDARAGERAHHARRVVRVDLTRLRRADQPERGRDLLRQAGQHARPGAGGRPRPEQRGEQLDVDVRPPRQPVVAHLRGGQRARGLGGDEQPQPVRPGREAEPPLLVGVHRDRRVQRVRAGRQRLAGGLEQRRLLGPGRRRRVVRLGQVVQARPRRGQVPRPARQGGVRQQDALGEVEVVAARQANAGRQQVRIERLGRGQHPARRVRRLGGRHPRRQVVDLLRGTGRGVRRRTVREHPHPAGPVRFGHHHDLHTRILRQPTDSLDGADRWTVS
jgi:hypothetical protein